MEQLESNPTEMIGPVPAPDPPSEPAIAPPERTTNGHRDLAEWRGRELVDSSGKRIGKLEGVYYDVETDEPQFGTVKEGFLRRHLTFVPLVGVTIGPDNLQVPASRQQIKDAPNVEPNDLAPVDESLLYHHYQLNYTPFDGESGRRLARR